MKKRRELYNEGFYYKVNNAYFWSKYDKQIIKRNTFTGYEEEIGMADSLDEAKHFAFNYSQANL